MAAQAGSTHRAPRISIILQGKVGWTCIMPLIVGTTHHKPLPKNMCYTHGWPQHTSLQKKCNTWFRTLGSRQSEGGNMIEVTAGPREVHRVHGRYLMYQVHTVGPSQTRECLVVFLSGAQMPYRGSTLKDRQTDGTDFVPSISNSSDSFKWKGTNIFINKLFYIGICLQTVWLSGIFTGLFGHRYDVDDEFVQKWYAVCCVMLQ